MSGVSDTLTPAISRVEGGSWLVDVSTVAVSMCAMAASSSCSVASKSGSWFYKSLIGSSATWLSLLERRLAEPLVEPDVTESRLAQGNQRTFIELGPEVPCVRIGHNRAGVLAGREALTDQFVETELLRTGHLDRAIHGGAHGDPADCLRDVIRRHRLEKHRGHPDGRSNGRVVGNALDELEELSGVNDRVRDAATLDQGLLSVLRAEIWAVEYPLGSDD